MVLAGAVLALLAFLLGLIAVILCVTVILLPVGLPLLAYASRVFALALKLMLPRAVSHPVRTVERTARKGGRRTGKKLEAVRPAMKSVRDRGRYIAAGGPKKALLG